MSLQVWLPLNGNIENKGLGEVSLTNNTIPIFKNNGKIGNQCLNLHTVTRLYSPNLVNLKTFSFAFWYKPEISTSTVNWNDVIYFYDKNQDETVSGNLRLQTSYNNTYMLSAHSNTSYNIIPNSSGTYGSSLLLSTSTAIRDKWYHIVMTVSEEKGINTYVDGILKWSIPHNGGHITGYFNLGEISSSGDQQGSMNDLRIYDHALSLKEIKEISKGLVLHYPLDDTYLQSTTNYLGLKSTSFNTWRSYGFGSRDVITETTDIQPALYGSVAMVTCSSTVTTNTSAEIATTFYTSNLNTIMHQGDTFTLSAYVKGSADTVGKNVVAHLYNSNGTDTLSNGTSYVLTDKWQRISHTLTWTKETDSSNSGNCYIYASIKNGECFYVSNVQVQKKNHTTPFTDSERNENIVYDCSGYQHNGTVNNITFSSDSPRYKASIQFNGTSSHIERNSLTPQIQSASFWLYLNNLNNQVVFTEYQSGLAFGIYNSYMPVTCVRTDTGSTTYLVSLLTANKWYFITLVKDLENSQVLLYIDGKKQNKHTTTDKWSSNILNNLKIGARGNNTTFFNGKISDFRMYAAILSEEDIKELYNIKAQVDRNSNFYTYNFKEEENNTVRISKQGISYSNNLIEGNFRTINDNIASFSDGAEMPVKSLKVSVEPVQDLHGYDSPWPAGGGKNMLSNQDGTYFPPDSNNSNRCYIIPSSMSLPAGTYYVGVYCKTATNLYAGIYLGIDGASASRLGSNTQYQFFARSFTLETTSTVVLYVYSSTNLTGLQFRFVLSTSALTDGVDEFSPYSNICPIIGHTQAVVRGTGINVWDEEWELGNINSTTGKNASGTTMIRSKNYVPVVPGATYYFKTPKTLGLRYYDAEKNYLVNATVINSTRKIPDGVYFLRFICIDTTEYANNISINYPESDTAYHAYHGRSITIDLDGTRYGAEVDVGTGVMKVTMVEKIFTGASSELWSIAESNGHYRAYLSISDIESYGGAYGDTSMLYKCDTYKNGTWGAVYGGQSVAAMTGKNWGIGIDDLGITQVGALRTYLANNNIQLVYKLATPLEVQLAGNTFSIYYGDNNIWADTGDINITYQASQKKTYINKNKEIFSTSFSEI